MLKEYKREDHHADEPKSVQAVLDNIDLVDFKIKSIAAHSVKKRHLHLLVELESREFCSCPLMMPRKIILLK